MTSKSERIFVIAVTLKNRSRSLVVELRQGHLEMHLRSKVELSELKNFWSNLDDEQTWTNLCNCPVTLKNRSRSLVVELRQGHVEMHLR